MKKFISCGAATEIVTPYQSKRYASNAKVDDDFLYVKVRAVSAGDFHGPNNNGDYFSADELRRAYHTFNSRGVFVNHQSDDVEKCRGRIVQADLIDRPGECYVTLVLGVDERAFPQLARSIRKGYVRDVSMGATVKYSHCSVCNNQAYNERQYCQHLANYKGASFQGRKVYEDNRDVNFFEISFVVDGADPDAKILELIQTRNNMQAYSGYSKKAAGMSKVASTVRTDEETQYDQISNYIKHLSNQNYTRNMVRLALKDKFKQLTQQDVEYLTMNLPEKRTGFNYTSCVNSSLISHLLK